MRNQPRVGHRRSLSPSLAAFAFAVGILAPALAVGQTLRVTVPGTANPWLAGMPDGTADTGGDVAPSNSPVQLIGALLRPADLLSFAASGQVGNPGELAGPDGSSQLTTSGARNGIADLNCPVNALVGVFLGPDLPTASPAPANLDFGSAESRDYRAIRPTLKQVFFIGDGRTSDGQRERVRVPPGATRLYLGTMDGSQWNNNTGSFDVEIVEVVTPRLSVTVEVPGTSDPWLAGMPAGTTASKTDVAPDQSPVAIPGLLIQGGATVLFRAAGAVSNGPGPLTGPDGEEGNQCQCHGTGAENGIGDFCAPMSSLVGLFLGAGQPDLFAPPSSARFCESQTQNYRVLAPELKQPFFIGDGFTTSGEQQQVIVPPGAKRLFLGTTDGEQWSNNEGFFTVEVDVLIPQEVELAVPGTSNPWLAGMPAGATDQGKDKVPEHSPQWVPLPMAPGDLLSFSASGEVGNPGELAGPDGSTQLTSHGVANGLSDINSAVNAVVGVFVGAEQPDQSPAPSPLDFGTAASRDYSVLSPELKQVFFIGDGRKSDGTVQRVFVPPGAVRLFLGTMDGSEWSNNVGSFAVKVTREPRPSLGLRMYAGITIAGSIGRTYQIEFLENLASTTWQTLEKTVLTSNPQVYIDLQSVDFPTRFYRARLLP